MSVTNTFFKTTSNNLNKGIHATSAALDDGENKAYDVDNDGDDGVIRN